MLKPIFAAVDASVLAAVFLLSYWLRFHLPLLPERPIPDFGLYIRFSIVVAIVGLGLLHSSGLYRLRTLSFRLEDFFAIVRAVTTSSMIIMATNFILRGYLARTDFETYSRIIIVFSWLLSIILLTAWRSGVSVLFRQLRKRGRGLRNVVIVGTDRVARGFHRAIQDNVEIEYHPIGFVRDRAGDNREQSSDLQLLGSVSDLSDILRRERVHEVVLASLDTNRKTVAQLVNICERADVAFSMIPGFFEILTRQMSVDQVADIPIFHLEERIFRRWGKVVKRGTDILLSLTTLIFLAPVVAILAALTRIESKGPVFYRHARVGKGERVFYMIKIRSMYTEIERSSKAPENLKASDELDFNMRKDAQVTSVGRFMRRFSLDEIPQVVNVLKGEMSWVGPRPHIPSEVAGYEEWHKRRYDVLPGITGLTQVSGRKDLTLDEMVNLDTYYIENWSPFLDLRILLRTIPAVLSGKGAY
jgi:exopolysaccharide biosynthesis polyprenyl glycosylphosphotransferase